MSRILIISFIVILGACTTGRTRQTLSLSCIEHEEHLECVWEGYDYAQ